MVKCLIPEFEYFYCILENRNFISEIRRSKVTDYAALKRSIRIISVKFGKNPAVSLGGDIL